MAVRRIFVRHAKSSWDDPSLADWARPLAPRGEHALPLLVAQLASWQLTLPISIYSSDAVRAAQTASAIQCAYPGAELTLMPDLYMASPRRWQLLLQQHPPEGTQIWVGHNPGLHLLIEQLSGHSFDKFPTAAMLLFKADNAIRLWRPKWGESRL